MSKPSLPILTRLDFYRLHGDEFLQALILAIDTHLGTDSKRPDRFAKLSPGLKSIYAWHLLREEIEEGGLAHYIHDPGQILIEALQTLIKNLRLSQLAVLLKKAATVYEKHKAAFEPELAFAKNGPVSRIKDFTPLNRAFEKLAPAVIRKIEMWTRKNIAKLFIGDDGKPLKSKFTGDLKILHPRRTTRHADAQLAASGLPSFAIE